MQGDFFLTTWFLEAMKWVYSNVNSVFLTILICTVVLRGITIFSDIATRKSQAKMNGIQPELAKIQKKYANDPSKSEKPMGIPNAIRTINTAAIAAITRTPPFPVFLLL